MSRADIAMWNAISSMPISMEGVNDGMWALFFIAAIVLFVALSATRQNRPPYYDDFPPNYPPRYPTNRHWW